jgi:hypothetical protein
MVQRLTARLPRSLPNVCSILMETIAIIGFFHALVNRDHCSRRENIWLPQTGRQQTWESRQSVDFMSVVIVTSAGFLWVTEQRLIGAWLLPLPLWRAFLAKSRPAFRSIDRITRY